MLVIAAGFVTGPCLGQPAKLELVRDEPLEVGGEAVLKQAADAHLAREFAQADGFYRQAWEHSPSRTRAAQGLKRLHRTPGFRLPVDEEQVSATLSTLGPTFVRRDTPHFVILSDCELRWTQARGDLLERTWAQFFRVADRLSLDAVPPQRRLLCILFNRRDDYRAFAAARDGLKSAWVGGYYATGANRIVFYNDASGQDAAQESLSRARAESLDARDRAAKARRDGNEMLAERLLAAADDLDERIRVEERRVAGEVARLSASKTIHEAVHLLAFNTGVQLRDREYPFWLSEGLATAFETESPTAAFGPDRGTSLVREEQFRRLLAEGKLPDISRLILVNDASALESDAAEALYSQSHALFMHLYVRDAAAVGRYIKALGEPRRRSASDHASLFTSTFGDPAQIQKRMITALSDRPQPAPR